MEEIALALLLLSGCDGEEASFGEREFVSESVEGYTLVPGSRVTMRFSDMYGFSASAGCNSISGEGYSLSGGTLVTGPLGMTEKGCGDGYHEQDEWLMAFLEASPSYVVEEPRLTLSDDITTIVMLDREVADPDRPLQGRTWSVDGLIDGAGVGFATTPQSSTLEFADDGTFSIVTPCAPGNGSYSVEGSSIALSGVAIEEVACPDDEFAVRYDEHMREVLVDGILEHDIEASRMTLMRGDIGLWLTTE